MVNRKPKRKLFDTTKPIWSASFGYRDSWDEKNKQWVTVYNTPEQNKVLNKKYNSDEKRIRKMWTKIIKAIREYDKKYDYPDYIEMNYKYDTCSGSINYYKPTNWSNPPLNTIQIELPEKEV